MKKRLLCIFLSLVLINGALIFRISRYYSLACDTYANNGIKGEISHEINKMLYERLNDGEVQLNHFSDIRYQNNGSISEIKINTSLLNRFSAETAYQIYNQINSNNLQFGIPIGNTLGINYLSGKGPKIEVKIVPIGSVEYEIKSELISGGINQTIHRISVDFYTKINCLTPFHDSKINIVSTIIISEILIVGDIPNILLPTR